MTSYDYEHQCWVVDGKVQPCNHPADMPCGCYGRLHAGEDIHTLNEDEQAFVEDFRAFLINGV